MSSNESGAVGSPHRRANETIDAETRLDGLPPDTAPEVEAALGAADADVAEKMAELETLAGENTRRLAALGNRGQQLGQAHPSVDQIILSEKIDAIIRAAFGELALLELDLHIAHKIADYLDEIEGVALQAFLTQPAGGGLTPNGAGNRAARRHG